MKVRVHLPLAELGRLERAEKDAVRSKRLPTGDQRLHCSGRGTVGRAVTTHLSALAGSLQ